MYLGVASNLEVRAIHFQSLDLTRVSLSACCRVCAHSAQSHALGAGLSKASFPIVCLSPSAQCHLTANHTQTLKLLLQNGLTQTATLEHRRILIRQKSSCNLFCQYLIIIKILSKCDSNRADCIFPYHDCEDSQGRQRRSVSIPSRIHALEHEIDRLYCLGHILEQREALANLYLFLDGTAFVAAFAAACANGWTMPLQQSVYCAKCLNQLKAGHKQRHPDVIMTLMTNIDRLLFSLDRRVN